MSKVQAADLEDCEDSYLIFFLFAIGHGYWLFKINHNVGGVHVVNFATWIHSHSVLTMAFGKGH